jgi:hypothetical protein
MSYKIDRAIPIPARRNTTGHRSQFPWTKMTVGDSFFAAGYARSKATSKRAKMSTTMGYKMVPNSSWAVREARENGRVGVRVWRTA